MDDLELIVGNEYIIVDIGDEYDGTRVKITKIRVGSGEQSLLDLEETRGDRIGNTHLGWERNDLRSIPALEALAEAAE